MANPVFPRWALVVFLCHCWFVSQFPYAEASHKVYLDLQSVEPDSVDPKHRTGYHFQPSKNWINDPNAPMHHNGVYHLFYQYNPKGAVWGNIVWAHSVSTDLINWKPLPPAIYPSKPFDINGCWSGSATILPSNKPAILYTGLDVDNNQIQNIAFPKNLSDPYLVEWTKPDYNPIIFPNGGINATAFRDPTTAWLGPDRHWRIVIGSKRKHRGMAVMYRSRDFKKWIKAKHPLHSTPDTGMWECPDFFPLAARGNKGLDTSVVGNGVKHVFKVSLDLTRYEYYTVGMYDVKKDKYVPDNTSADDHSGLRFDYGNFYASKTFFDPQKNRRILWGWSNESDSKDHDIAKGWAGVQAIPRAMWLDDNKKQVVQWPVEELETLRQKPFQAKSIKLKSGGGLYQVKGIQTHESDVEVTFDVSSLDKAEPFDPSWTDPQLLCDQKPANVRGGIGPFGLLVLASRDLREQTAVFFRVFKAKHKHVILMCHDISRSSLMSGVWKPAFGGFVDIDIAKEGKISLRSLIDNSVVESFGAEGRTVITSRVYPTVAEGEKAHLFAFNNGTAEIKISHLKAWEMRRPLMN